MATPGGPQEELSIKCTACLIDVPFHEKASHYHSDWHRYNVKRRCVELPPIPYDLFQQKLQEILSRGKKDIENKKLNKQSQKIQNDFMNNNQWNISSTFQSNKQKKFFLTYNCKLCKKSFKSGAQIESHLISKKHHNMFIQHHQTIRNNKVKLKGDEMEEESVSNASTNEEDLVPLNELKPITTILNNPFVEVREIKLQPEQKVNEDNDNDLNEDNFREMIPMEACLFCTEEFESIKDAQEHMRKDHGFFIPFPNKLKNQNIKELMEDIGELIGIHHQCCWCWKQFKSLRAVQSHMRHVQHCKIQLENGPKYIYEEYIIKNDSNEILNNNNDNEGDEEGEKVIVFKAIPNEDGESIFKDYFYWGNQAVDQETGLVVHTDPVVVELNEKDELVRANGTKIGHRSNLIVYRQRISSLSRYKETNTEEQLISQINNPLRKFKLNAMIKNEHKIKFENSGTKTQNKLEKRSKFDEFEKYNMRNPRFSHQHYKSKDGLK